jgi:Ca-activated chloride channel family protein
MPPSASAPGVAASEPAPVSKKAPQVTLETPQVAGRVVVPLEVIQRVVGEATPAFRKCYEAGLAKDPNLKGRVAARILIDADGNAKVGGGGDDIADRSVRQCVLDAITALKFPKAERGLSTLIYPIVFAPGD